MDLATAWASWPMLKDFSWTYFITATFPTETTSGRAGKAWSHFANKLGRQNLPAGAARREGLPWVRSVEQHKSGGAHVHALLSTAASQAAISALWREVSGSGHIDIQRYDSRGKALAYLVKSADNGGEIDVARYFILS